MYTPSKPIPGEFAGRRALVTGGTRGIGAAIAQQLLDEGASVVTTARTRAESTPEGSTFIAADLRSPEAITDLVTQAVEVLGGLDLLVHNAGAARVYLEGSEAIPDQEWQDSLDIHFLSAVRLVNAALPALREAENASVVNISTNGTETPSGPLLHYVAAKSALDTYTKGIAKDLAKEGIRVNLVTPGPVDTPGGTAILETIAEGIGATREALLSGVPLGRAGEPGDIAEAVTFLLSPRAQWITGANISVTGGS
ncbi:oxidoreductase [Streptacidiphilus sp. EB129]|uniref:oxidoreductase n=1 Tax=Streptacidiphilus sp. EB129 TaxID=3156262 RepID=UPI0035192FB3